MEIQGNSILSSVYIKSIDPGATLQVKYFDVTTGTVAGGERFDLEEHRTFTDADAGLTNRVTITRIHNKPHCEVIVSGGNVEFGIYITVVASFASDLDAALVLDGEAYRDEATKGIPLACYDEANDEMVLVRCDGNGLKVTGSLSVTPAKNPFNDTLDLVDKSTVYTWNIPNTTERFTFQNRGQSSVKFSYQSGGIALGNYFTLFPGQVINEPGIDTTNAVIEFQATKDNQTLEFIYWT
jgi:hypothetical protein